MTEAVWREGPCAPLFYSALLVSIAATSLAQTVERSELELCAGLETAELKLACFEAIIAASKLEESAAGEKEPPGTAATGVAEPVPAEVVTPAASQAVEAAAAAQPSPTTAAGGTSTPAANADFGREHIEDPADKRPGSETITVRVDEVRRARDRRLHFYFDNGHVWRQMEYAPFPYPKDRAFEVEIRRGVMGDYQLRVEGKGRMTRIVRIK